MNMKRMMMVMFLGAVVFLIMPSVAWANTTPAIKNVRASQNPTFKNVDIYYDLDGPASFVYKVSIEATAGGQCLPTKSLSGDIGQVNAGKNKKIIWRVATDWPNHKASDVVVSVKAELTAENPSSYSAITPAYIAYAYESGQMKAGKLAIKARQSASGSSPEQYFIYKTVQGRFGKFKISGCWCGIISLEFVTYGDDGKVHKKGSESLGYGSGIDFDTGAIIKGSSSSIDMKCFWDGKHGSSEHWAQAYGAMKKMR